MVEAADSQRRRNNMQFLQLLAEHSINQTKPALRSEHKIADVFFKAALDALSRKRVEAEEREQ